MGRRRDRIGFGRRQVLQLNDSKREDSPYRGHGGQWPPKTEANALSGLMAHYGDSDDSEQEEEEDFTPPPSEPPPLPPEDSVSPTPPPSESEPAPEVLQENGHCDGDKRRHKSLDIDSKVANFLAEIDALDNDGSSDIDGVPLAEPEAPQENPTPVTQPVPESMGSQSESEREEEEEDDKEEALVEPVAPVTVWQYCADENTQYYYYWNTVTNEVTWEIPSEYSQYLLQIKEHEEACMRYEAQKADREKLLQEKGQNIKKKREKDKNEKKEQEAPSVKTTTSFDEVEPKQEKKPVKSWLLKKIREKYGSKYDVEAKTEEPVVPLPKEEGPLLPSNTEDEGSSEEIGTQLPSVAREELEEDEGEETQIGPPLPPDESIPRDVDPRPDSPGEVYGPALPPNHYRPSLPPDEEEAQCETADPTSGVYGPALPPPNSEESVQYGPNLPPDIEWETAGQDTTPEGTVSSILPDTSTASVHGPTSMDTHSDLASDTDTDKPQVATSSDGAALIGPLLPDVNTPSKKEMNRGSNTDMEEGVDSDPEDDDDFIHKQLEIPVISHYEFVNKKYEAEEEESTDVKSKADEAKATKGSADGDVIHSEEEEEDVEFDIDDIDQQLEMALEKKKAELNKSVTDEGKSGKSKRKASDSNGDPEDTPKKRKPHAKEELKPTPPKKKMDKEEIKMKAEAADLASLVIDKLDFLEITRKGLSKLQILLIEIETRISDWREGGLNTKFLLGRLQDAELQLQQYESSAAPTGWACHWDRTYKRYFYCHNTTGATQWDYPEDELLKDRAAPSGDGLIQNGDSAAMETVKDSHVSSSQGEGREAEDQPQDAQIDSTTVSMETTRVSPSLPTQAAAIYPATVNMKEVSCSNGTGSQTSSTSTIPTSTFALDPSLYQKLFAPAPPPPTEPPPPGVDSSLALLGLPRPPPGLTAAPPPPPKSPPPPPPGTTPPLQTTVVSSDDADPEVSEMEPSSTNLLAAPPPPPPPAEPVVGSSTTFPVQYPHHVGPQPAAMIIAAPFITRTGGDVPTAAAAPANPTTIVAPPVVRTGQPVAVAQPPPTASQPLSGSSTPSGSPPHSMTFDMGLDGVPLAEPAPPPPPPPSAQPPAPHPALKEKKKKKEKKASMGLSLKKKNFPSLVQKWQQVQEEVEREVAKHAKDEEFDSS